MSTKSVIVNALTFSRAPLILAWLGFAIAQEYRGGFWCGALACLAMLFSGLTDMWDGQLARRWQVVSPLGKMADPLMDKVFYIVVFPTFIWLIAHRGESEVHGAVMLAFTILYLLRDTWVTFMRAVGSMYKANCAAMWLGKVRTALSFPGAGWVYTYLAFHDKVPFSWAVSWLVSCYVVEAVLIVLTLVSLWTYTAAYSPYLKLALDSKGEI